MAVAEFDYQLFLARFPEFRETVPSVLGFDLFAEASDMMGNTDTGSCAISNLGRRLRVLNMLTAHLAQLTVGSTGHPASPLVGKITSASEGSVSVSVDAAGSTAASSWYLSTKYGAMYWNATMDLRTMRYIPGVQPAFDRARWGMYGWRR